MKTNIFFHVVLTLGLAMVAPVSALGEDDPVLARVDGYEIHLSEAEEARTLLPPALQRADSKDVIALLVETIIDTRLAAKRATELGIDKTQQYKNAISRIEGQILKRMLFTREIEKGISEEAIKKQYEIFVENTPEGDVVHARHILLKNKDDGLDVIKKLNDGADFKTLAVEYSTGPSAQTGGDLGWFGEGSMVGEFEKEAFALKVGDYSRAPIKTRFGWHIILVEGRKKAEAPTMAEAREEIIRQLSSEIGQKLIDDLRKNAEVERFKIQPGPK